MARRLNTYVHVHVDGVTTVYGPDDEISKSVANLITAPDVWEGDEVDGSGESTESDIPKKNASKADWAAYADANGFDPEDLGRDEIIAALESNDIPVE